MLKDDKHLLSDVIKCLLPSDCDSPCCLAYLYHLGPPPSPEALLEARRQFGGGRENRCSVVCVPVSALEDRCDLIMAAWIIE